MMTLDFFSLIDKYKIVIPMLQRDYAYGRREEREKREDFLDKLRGFYLDDKEHILDFVYGSTRGGKLVLLDGQQRITTLFLINWYLTLRFEMEQENDEEHGYTLFKEKLYKDGEYRFVYQTRNSAEDFCKYLISEGNCVFKKYWRDRHNSKLKLSALICKEKNYLLYWNQDPTVKGMLNMLDAICDKFNTVRISCGREVNECETISFEQLSNIKFNFMDIGEYNLTDELYIKMNARGKNLTRFENFKTIWLSVYDTICKSENPSLCERYNKKLEKINQREKDKQYDSLRKYVSKMIDSTWTDAFWETSKDTIRETGDTAIIDRNMMNFVSVLAINHCIVSANLHPDDSETWDIDIIKLYNARGEDGYQISYKNLGKLLEINGFEFAFNLIDYLDVFCNGPLMNGFQFENEVWLFDQKVVLEKNVHNVKAPNYNERAEFYAMMEYIIHNPNYTNEGVESWMRFVCNILANSIVDSIPDYVNTVVAINKMLDFEIDNKREMIDPNDYSTVDRTQIEEEILKYKLSNSPNVEWKNTIIEAENKLRYLKGRMYFPLVVCAQVDEVNFDETKRGVFNDYINKLAAIFKENGSDRHTEHALIMAMLSKGDYLRRYNSNWSLLTNKGRDISWDRFLKDEQKRPDDKIDKDRREWLKEILDNNLFKLENPKGSLIDIARSMEIEQNNWRKYVFYFIEHFDMLKEDISDDVINGFDTDRCLRFQDNEIYILKGTRMSGNYVELRTVCLYCYLKFDKQIEVLRYKPVKGGKEPYFYFAGNVDDDQNKEIFRVIYKPNSENERDIEGEPRFKVIKNDGEEIEISWNEAESKLPELINQA